MSVWRTLAKLAGFGLFYAVVLALAVYWTFPWERAKGRVEGILSARLDKKVEIEGLGPYRVTGVELTGISIRLAEPTAVAAEGEGVSKGGAPDADPAPEGDEAGKKSKPARAPELRVERLAARLTVLPLLLGTYEAALEVEALGGELSGVVSLGKETGTRAADLEFEGLELGAFPAWKDWLGVPLSGRIGGSVDVRLDGEYFAASKGGLSLKVEGLRAGNGSIPLPAGSMFPQFDLESPTDLGRLEVEVKLGEAESPDPKGALAEIVRFEQEGADLSMKVMGSITVKEQLGFSRPNLDVELKPSDAFVKRNSLGIVLNNPRVKRNQKDGWTGLHVGGTLSKPTPRLQRPGTGRATRPTPAPGRVKPLRPNVKG